MSLDGVNVDLALEVERPLLDGARLGCFEARDIDRVGFEVHDIGHSDGTLLHLPAVGRVVLSERRPRLMLCGEAAELRALAALLVEAAELAKASDARYEALHPSAGLEPVEASNAGEGR